MMKQEGMAERGRATAAQGLTKRSVLRESRAAGSRRAADEVGAGRDLYGSIHALLHTMRLIEQQEERLCSMHDEMKRTGRLSAPMRRELERMLEDLPVEEYRADLEAVRQALSA